MVARGGGWQEWGPRLREACIPRDRLHLTLCTLQLRNAGEVAHAGEVLREIGPGLLDRVRNTVPLAGVFDYRGRVLHTRPTPGAGHDEVTRLSAALKESFTRRHVRLMGNRSRYEPHVTIAKLTGGMIRDGLDTINPALYDEHVGRVFGETPIGGLYLCPMLGDATGAAAGAAGAADALAVAAAAAAAVEGPDGYYPTAVSVDNVPRLLRNPLVWELTRRMLVASKNWRQRDRCTLSGALAGGRCPVTATLLQVEEMAVKEVSQEVWSQSVGAVMRELRASRLLQPRIDVDIDGVSSTPGTGGVVVIMRGLPGSGKSFLTRTVTNAAIQAFSSVGSGRGMSAQGLKEALVAALDVVVDDNELLSGEARARRGDSHGGERLRGAANLQGESKGDDEVSEMPPLPTLLRQVSNEYKQGRIDASAKAAIKELLLSGDPRELAEAVRCLGSGGGGDGDGGDGGGPSVALQGGSLCRQTDHADPRSIARICSADHFFETQGGKYVFKPKLIGQAHAACGASFLDALVAAVPVVVVDNTNTQNFELRAYRQVASLAGYHTLIVEVVCPDEAMVQVFQERCSHSVRARARERRGESTEGRGRVQRREKGGGQTGGEET